MIKINHMILMLVCTALLFCTGCDVPPYVPPPLEVKKIIEKSAPNENRFSAGDFVFGKGSVTKTRTVYYLIAEDGTVCEVGLSEYHKTKIGSMASCSQWEVQ